MKKLITVPLDERTISLLRMPTISSQIPIKFSNGKTLETFVGKCAGCDNTLTHITGSINRQFPNVAIVEAVGQCHDCLVITPFHYRIHDDLSISGKRDGKWRRWEMRTVSKRRWVEDLKRFFFGNQSIKSN